MLRSLSESPSGCLQGQPSRRLTPISSKHSEQISSAPAPAPAPTATEVKAASPVVSLTTSASTQPAPAPAHAPAPADAATPVVISTALHVSLPTPQVPAQPEQPEKPHVYRGNRRQRRSRLINWRADRKNKHDVNIYHLPLFLISYPYVDCN